MNSFGNRIKRIYEKMGPYLPTVTITYADGSVRHTSGLKAIDDVVAHAEDIVRIKAESENLQEALYMLLDSETGGNQNGLEV